jgi:perosamine synthetase
MTPPFGEGAVIPQHAPLFGEEEAAAVASYVVSGGYLTEHTKTRELEGAIAAYTGARHCVMAPNGTLSLTLAAIALGLPRNAEVIVPCYSMVASANAFKLLGMQLSFVDVEPDTLCIDAELVERALSHRTRAVVLVDANGRTPRTMPMLREMCAHHRIPIIEDAAQALGALAPDGRHCGRVGAVGSFSFSAPKVISMGQGGACITDDDDLAHLMRRAKDFGRERGGVDIHPTFGVNMKFTDLQAVVGLEQMKKLPERVARKKAIGARYRAGLAGISQVAMYHQESTPWFYDVLAWNRDGLRAHLEARGIGSRPMYPPIAHQKCYGGDGGSFPVAERVGRDGLWLPSSVQLTDEEVDRVCDEVLAFYA